MGFLSGIFARPRSSEPIDRVAGSKAELIEARTRIAALEASARALEKTIESRDQEIQKLRATLDQSIAKTAIDLVAGQGIPVKDLPKGRGGASSAIATYERLQAEGNYKAAALFYKDHKKEITQER